MSMKKIDEYEKYICYAIYICMLYIYAIYIMLYICYIYGIYIYISQCAIKKQMKNKNTNAFQDACSREIKILQMAQQINYSILKNQYNL